MELGQIEIDLMRSIQKPQLAAERDDRDRDRDREMDRDRDDRDRKRRSRSPGGNRRRDDRHCARYLNNLELEA